MIWVSFPRLVRTCFRTESGAFSLNSALRKRQSMHFTWSLRTTKPSGIVTSNGYPLTSFVRMQPTRRLVLPL